MSLLVSVGPGEERLRTLLQAGAVVATVATIALALFLQWGLSRYRRPRLTLTFSPALDDEDWAPLDFRDRAELFLRLRVNSAPKKATAHNVEVLLLKVRRPLSVRDAPVIPSRQLAWSDTPDERLAIPAGTWRRVDVLKLTTRHGVDRNSVLVPALKQYEDTRPRPVGVRRRLVSYRAGRAGGDAARLGRNARDRYCLEEDGAYEFDLAVTADEVESSRWRLSFFYRRGPAVYGRQLIAQITDARVEPLRRTGTN